jgi:hypothetical protein
MIMKNLKFVWLKQFPAINSTRTRKLANMDDKNLEKKSRIGDDSELKQMNI